MPPGRSPSTTRFASFTLAALLVLALAPRAAHAAPPTVSFQLGLGAEDVPAGLLVDAQPRLVLRLDRDARFTPYASLGGAVTIFSLPEAEVADGMAADAALGVDTRTCSARRLCLGLRSGLGAQIAHYRHGETPQTLTSTSAFVEMAPYVGYGRYSLGVELRVHRLLDPEPYETKLDRLEGSALFAVQF